MLSLLVIAVYPVLGVAVAARAARQSVLLSIPAIHCALPLLLLLLLLLLPLLAGPVTTILWHLDCPLY
jgi:hypothetical protein